jgi:uncharacterized protein (TIGR02117 family)
MGSKPKVQIKSILKWVTIGSLTTALVLTIAAQLPRRGGTQVSSCKNSPYSVYLVADSMHVDLMVPVENSAFNWRSMVKLETIGKEKRNDYQYLKFGWGDRDFYMNTPSLDQVQYPRLIRTLFAPGNPTAIHINGYQEIPIDDTHVTKCVGLTQTQYLNLVAYLRRSFRNGKPDRIQDGFVAAAGFYEATGFYSVANTCNNWVAGALDSADVTTPLWSGLSGPIMDKLGSPLTRNSGGP